VKKTNLLLISLIILPILTRATKVYAHGSKINYRETKAIEIQATYDDGTPMANAQIVIYAPNNRNIPWMKAQTDAEGKFTFIPDYETEGNWDVKVRQSGHGDIISIPVSDRENLQTQIITSNFEYNPMQKLVMTLASVWGFVGTALFFSRRKS